jgi:hypothetical protein
MEKLEAARERSKKALSRVSYYLDHAEWKRLVNERGQIESAIEKERGRSSIEMLTD